MAANKTAVKARKVRAKATVLDPLSQPKKPSTEHLTLPRNKPGKKRTSKQITEARKAEQKKLQEEPSIPTPKAERMAGQERGTRQTGKQSTARRKLWAAQEG